MDVYYGEWPLKDKIEQYRAYNRARKVKAIAFNESKATILFKIIPFLLHCNYPDLPGFIEDEKCPYGIYLLDPTKVVNSELFRRFFPTSTALNHKTDNPFSLNPCIHSLKTIGSIGTTAQTEKSDCDYWISVYLKELGPNGLELLTRKCRIIEDWATSRDIEVHFFLMDIDQTRENRFESAADEESAGSSLQLLLKDELFRTHILVAGKMLLWWLIPPGLTEKGYQDYVVKLIESNAINSQNCIDLGYIADIPKTEIFGACLWQMNKALDSPFKSIIKFAYLELLLDDEKQKLPLFSDRVKCLVTFRDSLTDERDIALKPTDIDPYLLLAREIVAFYQLRRNEQKRANLIRECFFLKALEGMVSQKKTFGRKNTRLQETMQLMREWQLLPSHYKQYTNVMSWKYKKLVDFGTKVHGYLIETYKRLRWIFKSFEEGTKVAISERDIAVLGRKLFTFYEKKPNKIEYIRSLSRETMTQNDITIHITRYKGVDYYYAFQGEQDNQSIKNRTELIIRRELHPITLLTWLIVNGILSKQTTLHLTKNFLPIDLVDLQKVAESILNTFPTVKFSSISAEQLLQAEKITRGLIILNMNKHQVKNAKTFESTIITCNSFGEYFVHDYTTLTQLKNAMRTLLTKHYVSRWNKNLDIYIPTQPEQHVIKSLVFN